MRSLSELFQLRRSQVDHPFAFRALAGRMLEKTTMRGEAIVTSPNTTVRRRLGNALKILRGPVAIVTGDAEFIAASR